MNLSSPVLYSQGPFSALNNRQLENDEKKNEFNHECAASSVYRETLYEAFGKLGEHYAFREG